MFVSCAHQTAHCTVGRNQILRRLCRAAPRQSKHLQPTTTTTTTTDRQQQQRVRTYSSTSLRCKGDGETTSSYYYYDSQSGRHVPIHNETEISVFLRATATTIPSQLYQQSDGDSDMLDEIKSWQQQGIHGLILPAPPPFPRDGRNLATLAHIKPRGFRLFAHLDRRPRAATALKHDDDDDDDDMSVLLEYSRTDEDNFRRGLQECVQQKLHTTIVLQQASLYHDGQEPILVLANQVAECMDAHGGGDCIWLAAPGAAAGGAVVRLAEELNYLDLPGATVQSRLMVSASEPEIVEEIMTLGVNKFVVDHGNKDQMEMVRQTAEEQGKSLLVR